MENRDVTDLKEIIYLAKGSSRSINQYAEDSGISPAALYRLANGNITKPLSEEKVRALADNAAQESGVTYEKLYDAILQFTARKIPVKIMSEKMSATAALLDKVLDAPNSTISRCAHPHIDNLSRGNPPSSYFDLSIKVEFPSEEQSPNSLPSEEYCYFRIANNPLGATTLIELYQFTGRIMHSARPASNEHYYLVFINKDSGKEVKRDNSTTRLPARRADAPFNLSVIFADYDGDNVLSLKETVLLGNDGLVVFE